MLSSSSKLELVGCGSGVRNKQQGGSGYEADTHFMALDVSEKYESQIQWPLQHLEILWHLDSINIVNCVVLLVFTVFIHTYIHTHTHITFVNI